MSTNGLNTTVREILFVGPIIGGQTERLINDKIIVVGNETQQGSTWRKDFPFKHGETIK